MKKKFLITLFFCLTACILIYNTFKDENLYYIALGEIPRDKYRYEYQDYVIDYLKKKHVLKKFNKNFLRESYDTNEFLTLLTEARTSIIDGKKETVTSAISKADIITLALGNNEIEKIINSNYKKIDSKETYKEIDKMFERFNLIIEKIRFLTSSPLIIIGYYNSFNNQGIENLDLVYKYAEEKLMTYSNNEEIYVIKLYEAFEENKIFSEKINNYAPSIEGYRYIADKIIDIINTQILT